MQRPDDLPRMNAAALGTSKGEAAAIETELLKDYRFGQQQLVEIWGQACAVAIAKAYPLSSLGKKQPTVLVICGPEQNGSIGLVCARHLRIGCYANQQPFCKLTRCCQTKKMLSKSPFGDLDLRKADR
ncbi:YjeF N-terminal domain-containing protein 3 [Takifugu flavidus]|uniref:YjeF N-terminal domain-containing protein 3 n=1 Tax=Takifugu flavidus TaxID=433684 RepID=A0A5C6MUA7_9TELE|nr:YjeF N-terminal domain-containing protein 3 [Takifugu flavidus]